MCLAHGKIYIPSERIQVWPCWMTCWVGNAGQNEVKRMVMTEINMEKAKDIANKKKLKPGKVKGTKDGIQFTSGRNDRLEVIDWNKFEDALKKKKLAIFESGGWMKIMKKGK